MLAGDEDVTTLTRGKKEYDPRHEPLESSCFRECLSWRGFHNLPCFPRPRNLFEDHIRQDPDVVSAVAVAELVEHPFYCLNKWLTIAKPLLRTRRRIGKRNRLWRLRGSGSRIQHVSVREYANIRNTPNTHKEFPSIQGRLCWWSQHSPVPALNCFQAESAPDVLTNSDD